MLPGARDVRAWRQRENLTQAALAAKIGIDGSYLRHFENGHRILPLRQRIALHELTGIRIQRLLLREEIELARRVCALVAA